MEISLDFLNACFCISFCLYLLSPVTTQIYLDPLLVLHDFYFTLWIIYSTFKFAMFRITKTKRLIKLHIMTSSKLRSTDNCLKILEKSHGIEHLNITGSRLPTYEQVLMCYMSNMEKYRAEDVSKNSKLTREVSKVVVDKILIHSQKAGIDTKAHHKMAEDVENIHSEYVKVNKRKNPSRIGEFRKKLNKTMPFWTKTTINNMKSSFQSPSTSQADKKKLKTDIEFLNSMMTDRVATYASKDVPNAIREMKRHDRQVEEEKRKMKEVARMQQVSSPTPLVDTGSGGEAEDTGSEIGSDTDNDANSMFTTPPTKKPHKRTVKSGTTITLCHDFMKSPSVVSALVRNKVMPTAAGAIFSALIEDNCGDSNAVNLSYTQIYRYRTQSNNSIANKIHSDWLPPAKAVIHWDGKLMATLDSSEQEERLPILLSGIGGSILLGVPSLPHLSTEKAGDLISKATITLLRQWNCRDNVVGMVFDTTSANTGHKTAGCISIQRDLDKPLLWLACRHHIGEVLLDHVWNQLAVEVSKSPEVTVFTKFKSKWDQLTYNDMSNLSFPVIDGYILGEKKLQIIAMCQELLAEKIVRCDYKEVVELTLLYLSGDGNYTTFNRPGALHKARWMAKILYSLKMVLLSDKIEDELPKGSVFASGQLQKIQTFVKFCVFVYVPWWLTSPNSAAAPYNDLMLIKGLSDYSVVDRKCTDAARKAFSNHMWYLTQELVPLSLFSSEIEKRIKEEIATKLLSYEKKPFSERFGSGLGKPKFPEMPKQPVEVLDLSLYVGPSSWSFFQALDCSHDFLNKPVDDWSTDEGYLATKDIVESLAVVNDAAERGVKLGHDFLSYARNEENYQNILQVVENDRKSLPNQRKRHATNQKSWFLKLTE